MTTLVRTWAGEASSHSTEDPPVHNVHNKLNETEQRKRLFLSPCHPAVDKMIRVNQAGERAAIMIYAGQTAVLGKAQLGNLIQVSQCIMCMGKTGLDTLQIMTWLGYTMESPLHTSWVKVLVSYSTLLCTRMRRNLCRF